MITTIRGMALEVGLSQLSQAMHVFKDKDKSDEQKVKEACECVQKAGSLFYAISKVENAVETASVMILGKELKAHGVDVQGLPGLPGEEETPEQPESSKESENKPAFGFARFRPSDN